MIRDAAETLFVPLCVYNNTKGDDDARTLASFKEAAWNNPVVRILDRKGEDLIPRIHDDWTLPALSRGMVKALKKDRKKVPPYLDLLATEQAARSKKVKTAIFVMH